MEKLKTECPSGWSPVKEEIDESNVDMPVKYEETMSYIGKASPVSIILLGALKSGLLKLYTTLTY
jgi:hypothetical protein